MFGLECQSLVTAVPMSIPRERDPGSVFVMAAEFLNITEKTGMVNLTVRFSVMKSWLMSSIIFSIDQSK